MPGSRAGGRIAPRSTSSNLAAYVPTLGAVPLDFQPGTEWRYSALAGIETLGRIVEIASGMTFDQFLKTADLRAARDEGHGVLSDRRRNGRGS